MMKHSKLPLILVLIVSVVLIGVLIFLHFHVPVKAPQPPASSAEQSGEALPSPWTGGDIITRIG